MTNALTVTSPAFVPSQLEQEGKTKNINPAQAYIISLRAQKSKDEMTLRLNFLCRRLWRVWNESAGLWEFGGYDLDNPREEGDDMGANMNNVNWRNLRYEHVELVKAYVQGKGRSMSTVHAYIMALRGVAKKCFRLGYFGADVLLSIQSVEAPTPNDHKEGRALEHKEIRRLFAALDEEANPVRRARDNALMALMFHAGLRIVDTQRLEVKDVLDDCKALVVHRKGGKVQTMSVNPLVTEALIPWMQARGRSDGPVICQIRKGTVIKPWVGLSKTSYRDLIMKYCGLGAIKGKLTPHDARRTFAKRMWELDVPIEIIQELMGHSSIETTKIYIGKLTNEANEVIAEIDLMKRPYADRRKKVEEDERP